MNYLKYKYVTLFVTFGEEVTLVMVAVQVSVTSFSSDLTLIPPPVAGGTELVMCGLCGALTRFVRSVRPVFHAWIGTCTLLRREVNFETKSANLAALTLSSNLCLLYFLTVLPAALHSSFSINRPTLISDSGFLHFLL